MEFRLLGPFEARRDGRLLPLGGRRQERCLLAVLLLEADRVVTVSRLIGVLWGDTPPASARGTVHTYIGRLRAALAPHGLALETVRDGYRVKPGPHTVDARDFTALVRRAARAAEPARRIRLYDEALALWRGPLLLDAADDALRDRLGAHLADLRLTALEERAAEHLFLGLHERVVSDLTGPASEHPGRERLVAALMTALHRGGRQTDALELYRSTRRALVRGLGVEPGGVLTTLHDRILRGDPRLDGPSAPLHAVRVGGEWLPWTTSGHPALEFCNTFAGWGGPRLPGSEWLTRYGTLAVWCGHHGVVDERTVGGLLRQAAERPAEAGRVLDRARGFRARLYTCLTRPDDVPAFRDVAAVVDEAAAHSRFVRGEDGLGHWQVGPAAGLSLPLFAVARSAAGLLADPRRLLVRACPGEGCGWLFSDESGRRRWCSLRTCGGAGTPVH
ncbi:BTAD domain-containing putative transcriptional regulator [Streptomyces tirandamycinicus]|uniref:BTAD domain-containing putative transcriptional regulator n=1 Tax=Streptomyces tirandamycinicus TaxID=2174846 RepID=UPI0034233669